jgi:hypothetical protein
MLFDAPDEVFAPACDLVWEVPDAVKKVPPLGGMRRPAGEVRFDRRSLLVRRGRLVFLRGQWDSAHGSTPLRDCKGSQATLPSGRHMVRSPCVRDLRVTDGNTSIPDQQASRDARKEEHHLPGQGEPGQGIPLQYRLWSGADLCRSPAQATHRGCGLVLPV